MRILVLGAGVIGSVYAGGLLGAGHDVVLLARGRRLVDLRESGLILHRADTNDQTTRPVEAVPDLAGQDAFDLVLVPVRSEQLAGVLPVLGEMSDGSTIVFFGNYSGRQAELTEALGGRVVWGFPAVGGVRDGPVVRYVPISQQRTMLGEPDGQTTPRIRQFGAALTGAGFATSISTRMDAWLLGHAAFIAPIGCALQMADTDPGKLARDRALLKLMVRATRQGFRALAGADQVEIPTNLRALYLGLPTAFAIVYWKRVLAGPRGELWFAAHTRAAPEEMAELAKTLDTAVRRTERPAPDLLHLIETARASQL